MSTEPVRAASRPSRRTGSFLEDVHIDLEPVDLFGRAVAVVYDGMRHQGIDLEFGSFDELTATWKANADNWLTVFPTFDPANGLVDPDTAFWLCGRNDKGDVVCSWAVKLFNWRETSFAAETASLRLLFADPTAALARGVSYRYESPAIHAVTGIVAFEGAGWVRPDYRGRGLMSHLSCVAKAVAAGRWNIDYAAAAMLHDVVDAGLAGTVGYANVDRAGVVVYPPLGTFHTAAIYMTRPELVAFVQAHLSRQAAQIDAAVKYDAR